jgi:hypothetical protein
MRYSVTCVLLVLCTASIGVEAKPVISSASGTIKDGETVIILGQSFGIKSQAKPVLWDTFESGSSGQRIENKSATVGNWNSGGGSGGPVYDSSLAHNGGKSSKHSFGSAYNSSLAKNMSFKRLYLDFWLHVDYATVKSRNWKPWRFYGGNDSLQMNWVWYCNGQALTRYDSAGLDSNSWVGSSYSDRSWHHFQLAFEESGPGQNDGTIRHFIDSKMHGLDSGNTQTRSSNTSFSEIRLGHYWATDSAAGCPASGGAEIHIDNVYIDTSWSRVEIGNSPTYASSTHREIQVPVDWQGSKINVEINTGSFQSGQDAYLYVFDSNNVPNSQGYPIVISEGSVAKTKIPKPPSDLVAF